MLTTYTKELNYLNQQPFLKDEVKFNLLHRILEGELAVALYVKDKLIALQNKSHPMVVWLNTSLPKAEKQKLLKQLYLHTSDCEIPVITAEPSNAIYLAELFKKGSGFNYETKMDLMSYYCPKVNELKKVNGEMRLAKKDDLETIVDFCVGFVLDGFGKTVTRDSQLNSATRLIESKKLYVWQCNERVVSMANLAHQSPRHCRINNVYTPPMQRSKGFATALTAELSQKILNNGFTPVLFTDLSNPISNWVYKKAGYQECGKIKELKIIK